VRADAEQPVHAERAELKRAFAPLLVVLLLGGCTSRVPPSLYTPCKALATRDWSARVEVEKEKLFPFPEEAVLLVAGTVQLPTGGFALAIEDGPLVRLDPPVQQVILRTIAPEGMATQAVTEQSVSGRVRFDRRAKSVAIRCGDGIIAEIPAIEDPRSGPAG
jgi:hypothetical protein